MKGSIQDLSWLEAKGWELHNSPAGEYFYHPDHELCPDGKVIWFIEEIWDFYNPEDPI